MNIPFNMEYEIDESLREIPKDPISFSQGIDFLLKESTRKTGIEKAKLLSQAGVYQRIKGDIDKSLSTLTEANAIISNQDQPRLKLVTNVRIAQTLQFLKRFEESEKLYLKLEDEIHRNRELKNLLHFVFQHRGKLLFDQNRFSESILQFEKALELRVQLGNQELIESTLFAIELTKRKLSE